MGGRLNWQDGFQRLGLVDTPLEISRETSQNDLRFQHRFGDQDDKDNIRPNFDSSVTLRYRDSVSSNASTLSRNSTLSSIETRYFSALGSPGPTPQTNNPLQILSSSSQQVLPLPLTISATFERPNRLSPLQAQFQQNIIPLSTEQPQQQQQQQQKMIEPTGCFVPVKALPFIQRSDITRHHYVIPTFAMAGESQAGVMNLLFNQVDVNAFKPKEEFERTIPWHTDGNSSLITLSQYTTLGQENPVSRNYLSGLGQRLGITTILVIVSIEVIGTVYPLLDNLIKAMESDDSIAGTTNNEQGQSPSWWSRVVLVINQQHGVTDEVTYNQRKHVLVEEMPRIENRYRLTQPLSILFLSTQVYNKINKSSTSQAAYYQSCCQRILYQMMEKHMLSGRWCCELQQNIRMNSVSSSSGSLLNVLNEDDESDSSSDDAIFKTVIDYVDGKKKRPIKKKKNSTSLSPLSATSEDSNSSNMHQPPTSISPLLQRRATRRQVQKLHCHDGDDPSTLPTSIRRA